MKVFLGNLLSALFHFAKTLSRLIGGQPFLGTLRPVTPNAAETPGEVIFELVPIYLSSLFRVFDQDYNLASRLGTHCALEGDFYESYKIACVDNSHIIDVDSPEYRIYIFPSVRL